MAVDCGTNGVSASRQVSESDLLQQTVVASFSLRTVDSNAQRSVSSRCVQSKRSNDAGTFESLALNNRSNSLAVCILTTARESDSRD